ncbi:uncharacterized protein T551_00587 [Pneumocystis jirovecii RU7]|uniref:Ribosome biogenesis protein NOP53 n=1 Tax=Pneumocystis jirovecii (strain RU7) TaxID=1408657 RepID=A0A0W4ZVU9_PNEJ7|nr:uncharacterized protein T551_00587 [Pneumocystis jirovecii RU7]KTW32497.1 hypothetical protein T551_00587 [Pneumocystis jirovecii RU7]
MKFLQPSRKSKSWQKSINLNLLEQGLEEFLEGEINGYVISKIPDERLFFVDLEGDTNVYGRPELGKFLKADKILFNDFSISIFSHLFKKCIKNTINKLKYKKWTCQGILNSEEIKSRKPSLKFNNGLNNVEILKNEMSSEKLEFYDIWESDHNFQSLSFFSYLYQQNRLKALSTLLCKSFFITNDAFNLKVVDTRLSYNPLFVEFKKLLENEMSKVFSKEIKNDQKKNTSNILNCGFVVNNAIEDSFKNTSFRGKIDSYVIRKAVKKIEKQRKKELQKKEEDGYNRKEQHKKQIRDLSSINKILKSTEEKTDIQKLTNINNFKHRVICKRKRREYSLTVSPLEIQSSDELTKSFRLFKPQGNMFTDRFIILQERGFIEPRFPVVSHRKYSQFYAEKWSYKGFKL